MAAADVIIASNRGPVSLRKADDGSLTSARGGGGLVSGMAGLGADGEALWVCASLSDADREAAAGAQDGRLDLAGYDTGGPVQMLAIDAATIASAYTSIANTTLWYVHHHLDHAQPVRFDEDWYADWAAYLAYNAAFADAIAAAAGNGGAVLVQDYQLTVLPAMLRERRPDLRIGHFTHTPWASPAVFTTLPDDVAQALLVGMLGADSVGFHSSRWSGDFIACCETVLGATVTSDSVEYAGRTTSVQIHPLGVDAEALLARAGQADVAERRAALAETIGNRTTIVRVDRTEPSKNIARGLEAFRDLLVRYPEHRGRIVHLAVEYPSRQDVEEYRVYTALVRELAADINAELAAPDWQPVELMIEDDYARSLATLQLGDVLLVNPVRDGMNLVAKEGALLGADVVLILSVQAGAADEMHRDALMVDPFDIAATADAMHEALKMDPAERARRHEGLVAAATAVPPKDWLKRQLDALPT